MPFGPALVGIGESVLGEWSISQATGKGQVSPAAWR